MEKITKHDKEFGKKTIQPTEETICLPQKEMNQSHDSSRGDGSKRGHGRNNFIGRGSRHDHGDRFNIQYLYY